MRKCLIVFVILSCIIGCKHFEKNNAEKIIHINLDKINKIDSRE